MKKKSHPLLIRVRQLIFQISDRRTDSNPCVARLYKLAGLIHLVSVVKRVVHEPGDERGFAHRLLAEKNQFKLSQRVTEVTRGRHSEWLFIVCDCDTTNGPWQDTTTPSKGSLKANTGTNWITVSFQLLWPWGLGLCNSLCVYLCLLEGSALGPLEQIFFDVSFQNKSRRKFKAVRIPFSGGNFDSYPNLNNMNKSILGSELIKRRNIATRYVDVEDSQQWLESLSDLNYDNSKRETRNDDPKVLWPVVT